MEETVEAVGYPWWMWGVGAWLLIIVLMFAWDFLKRRQEKPAIAPAKGPAKFVEPELAAAASAGVPASAVAASIALPSDDRDEARPVKRMQQGHLPLPAGQHEFRLVRAVEGDKIRAETLILQELQLVPYQSREEAAASALQRLRTGEPRAA